MAYISQIKLSNTTYDISAIKLKNARTLTIGATGKTFDGSANLSWNHKEMGVLPLTKITGSQDANSLTTSGLYSLYTTTTTNVPTTNHAFLLVGGQGDVGTKFQIFIADSSNTIYKRSYNNTDSVWRDWSKSWDIDITGRAATATKLATARTISLMGDVTGSGTFDGSNNLSITATVADNSHNHSNYMTDSQSVPNACNFNTVTKSGVYRYNDRTTYTNSPPHSWGQMLVLHGAGDTIAQLAFDYAGPNVWLRQGNPTDCGGSGSWRDWKHIWCEGNSVTGAVWNDYAECRESDCEEFGYVLMETGDDSLTKTTERLSHFAGVSSDTWGFSQGETARARTPIAVAGRVLVYPYQDRNNYKPGDCVCAAPGGTVDIMAREEVREWPDRIVGTVSCVPDYEEWGGGEGADRDSVKVNGRIWIKVK